jgi:hypothetical protein
MKIEPTIEQQYEDTSCRKENVTALHQINAGGIFHDLKRNWRRFEPEFITEFIETMESIAIDNGSTVSAKDKNNWPYLENNKAILSERKRTTNPDVFPYVDYFFSYERGADKASLYSFDEERIIEQSHTYFDLFFTLKLVFIDPLNINTFFDWQLDRNFNSDLKSFESFLDNLSLKYYFIRDWNYTDKIKQYLNEKLSQVSHEKINIDSANETVTSVNAQSDILTILSVTQAGDGNADQETNKKANLKISQQSRIDIKPKEYYLDKLFLNIQEVSELTGIPVGTIYQKNHKREIPLLNVGNASLLKPKKYFYGCKAA